MSKKLNCPILFSFFIYCFFPSLYFIIFFVIYVEFLEVPYIIKNKKTEELKSIENYEDRLNIFKNAFELVDKKYEGKRVLLFDDIYRFGATLNTLTNLLYNEGKVDRVYVLTLTKTRVKK